ncbi:MAG TPA: lytic transglycosylase domain-containing protein [Thioalkalivibrio sp.]|nr:lytic transglycosylase domain-containing protein [Thioalkalivibrio sp.]
MTRSYRTGNRHTGKGLSLRRSLVALALGTAMATGVAQAERYYIYKEDDGTTWITDRKLHEPDRYAFQGYYGRPAATRSCHGVTSDILEQRAQLHAPVMRRYARQHGIDELLVKAIITVESCFDTKAVSRVGAEGLMQLMPQTATSLGVTDSFSAHQNIAGGVRYFAEMMERFNNDTTLALAAYNAGPNAVTRHGGIPPYRETQGYVKKVLSYYQRYLEQHAEATR